MKKKKKKSRSSINSLVLPPAGYWHKRESQVPRYTFGKGSKKDFSWYFEGKSKVKVKSLREICKWLAKCEYVRDEDLFLEDDFWQHPVTFEALRKGDCEDHALWAWRKLIELKIPAEFVAGQWIERTNGQREETGHAWVNFQDKKMRWNVLECTEKNSLRMIVPFDDAEKRYFPEVSVDGELKTYRFTVAKKRRRR